MGWSTWCTNDLCGLRDKCTEHEIKKHANAMVEQGMSDLGYKWISLHYCWASTERDASGQLQATLSSFRGHEAFSGLRAFQRSISVLVHMHWHEDVKKNHAGTSGNYVTMMPTHSHRGVSTWLSAITATIRTTATKPLRGSSRSSPRP